MNNIVLANGAFPTRENLLQLLQQADNLICCDGAIDKLTAHGIAPTAIVGDCDSMNPEDLERWKTILYPDHSEEYNDLQKALKYCLANGLNDIALLGCGGLRDDHFLANISIMATYSDRLKLRMINDNGAFYPIRKTTTLSALPGQQVSIFSKDENLPLTFHGLKYPVKERCFSYLWEGSLNEAISNSFTIELHGEGIVLVYVSE